MVTIKRSSMSKGAYGKYYHSKGIGIKVLTFADYGKDLIEEAVKETALLSRAYKSGITPKVYGIIMVSSPKGKKRYPAIVMEHIPGLSLFENPESLNNRRKIMRSLKKRLKDTAGLVHNDLITSWQNIIFNKKKNKYYIVDFSPSWVRRI